jgi:hypothetical protein
MAITGFSEKFQSELEVEQYLSKMGYAYTLDKDIKRFQLLDRRFISKDISCPQCKFKGATVVPATVLKQAYFKFRSHDVICSYNSERTKNVKERLIDFRKHRSNQTAIIREWVARGIEQKMFSQETIKEMRDYFYNAKINSLYKMDISKDTLEFFKVFINLDENLLFLAPHIKLNPAVVKEVNFNWRKIAELYFIKESHQLIEYSKRLYLQFESKKIKNKLLQVDRLIRIKHDSFVIDAKELYVPYRKTVMLTNLINNFYLNAQSLRTIDNDILYAFVALLLFISEWDMNLARQKFQNIIDSSNAIDINSGNVIGLNPFYKIEPWLIISTLKQIAEKIYNHNSYESEITRIEEQLKNVYEQWKLNMPKDDSQTE